MKRILWNFHFSLFYFSVLDWYSLLSLCELNTLLIYLWFKCEALLLFLLTLLGFLLFFFFQLFFPMYHISEKSFSISRLLGFYLFVHSLYQLFKLLILFLLFQFLIYLLLLFLFLDYLIESLVNWTIRWLFSHLPRLWINLWLSFESNESTYNYGYFLSSSTLRFNYKSFYLFLW